MRRLGILYNPLSESSTKLSADLIKQLNNQGIAAWRGISQEGRDDPAMLEDIELLLALGGDGTILRAARLAIPFRIPVMPVALGHLSFMAEIGPDELLPGLHQWLEGHGWHDERALLTAVLHRHGEPMDSFTAVNEIVVSRSDLSRIVNVNVEVDEAPLTTYHADGVIVSTATGSTAYALAAGGPIVDPRSRSLILVPVAAHLTNVPSMVLHDNARINLSLQSRHHASLAVDGRENLPLLEGDIVEIQRSAEVCVFARTRSPSEFYANLIRRLRRD
jgi:NAD+ kinase